MASCRNTVLGPFCGAPQPLLWHYSTDGIQHRFLASHSPAPPLPYPLLEGDKRDLSATWHYRAKAGTRGGMNDVYSLPSLGPGSWVRVLQEVELGRGSEIWGLCSPS